MNSRSQLGRSVILSVQFLSLPCRSLGPRWGRQVYVGLDHNTLFMKSEWKYIGGPLKWKEFTMIESIWNLSKCKVLCQLLWCVSQVSTSGCRENALLSCIKLMLTQHQRFDLNQQHYKHLGSQTWSNKNSRLYTGSMPQEQKSYYFTKVWQALKNNYCFHIQSCLQTSLFITLPHYLSA